MKLMTSVRCKSVASKEKENARMQVMFDLGSGATTYELTVLEILTVLQLEHVAASL
jgi:hypothetical protein